MSDRAGDHDQRDPGDVWAAHSLASWRRISAIAALIMLVILAWVPTKEFFRPWRNAQGRYNELAVTRGLAAVAPHVRQVWFPETDTADRCGTCHLAMAGDRPIDGEPPFQAHPAVPHATEQYGCTLCHFGQGRATVAADAHGDDGSWPHPILELARTEAGCGSCHSGLEVPSPEDVEDAPKLVVKFGCQTCHEAPERNAPTLHGIALRGFPTDWVGGHRGLAPPDDQTTHLSEADPDEIETLGAWLRSQLGMQHLARGKMLFHQLGCLGCHRRGDIGGDVGPELTAVGGRDVRELGGEESSGSATLPDWLHRHLLEPQSLDENSRMPPVDPDVFEVESDLDDLVTYLLSLRDDPVPSRLTPPDRVAVAAGLRRDVPYGGRGLYMTFCSACHGEYGEGKEMEALGLITPMIGTRGHLAVVTPRFVRATILRGRRGRYMPAWGSADGGLSGSEIDAIVSYLFDQGSKARHLAELTGDPDLGHGRAVYGERCAHCHSTDGTTRFGEDLLRPEALAHFSPSVLNDALMNGWAEEGMPSYAFLEPADARDLIAFLAPGEVEGEDEIPGRSGRHSYMGYQSWTAKCAECHGAEGEGGSAPLLNSTAYLRWANDAYIGRRIYFHASPAARARIGEPSAQDVDAILDYMRTWSGLVAPATPGEPSQAAVDRGRDLYVPRCTECHGGEGRGKTATSLANADFSSLVTRPFLVMTILEGRKGTPMQSWRTNSENPVTLQDAYDLADYILWLGRPGPIENEVGTATTSSR